MNNLSQNKSRATAILLISCPDQKGLVATVSDFIYRNQGNIIHADQHTDQEKGIFLQRVEWDYADFVAHYPNRIINIHHSFLPAFAGSRPYHQAHTRGVKIIGATAHYVTAELDQGPIIEQDVVRVSHRDTIDDLIRKGRDLEKIVLARAVRMHLLHRVLVYENKTVVFD